MKVSDVHLQVKQGLVELGKYADGSILISEIDLVLDLIVLQTVADVLKASATETNTFYASLLNDLKEEQSLATTKDYNIMLASLPKSCVPLKVSVKREILLEHIGENLIIGKYYKPVDQARINNTWYKSDQTVKATSKDYYGEVKEVSYTYIPTRLTSSEKIDVYLTSHFNKSTNKSPLSEIIGNIIKVHSNCGDNIVLSYYKKPIEFSTLKEEDESPYSDITTSEFIKITIQNIKNRK